MLCREGRGGKGRMDKSRMNTYFKTLGRKNISAGVLMNSSVYSGCSFFNLFNKPLIGVLTVPGPRVQEEEVTSRCVGPRAEF